MSLQLASKRIQRDLREVEELSAEGIWFVPNEQNFYLGEAWIGIGIGVEESCGGGEGGVVGGDANLNPYLGGVYWFSVEFPKEYPFEPPVVRCRTNDGKTRIHPNIYTDGKLCLSILNTWKGEQWTSCQSLREVLLAIRMLFGANPLQMEPRLPVGHPETQKYHQLIQYANLELAVYPYRLLPQTLPPEIQGKICGLFQKYHAYYLSLLVNIPPKLTWYMEYYQFQYVFDRDIFINYFSIK